MHDDVSGKDHVDKFSNCELCKETSRMMGCVEMHLHPVPKFQNASRSVCALSWCGDVDKG